MYGSAKKIILVGMPGSGKSSIGALLARYLNIPFFDLDHEVAADQAMAISQIFEKHGEGYFRWIEHQTLFKLLLKKHSFVLATGGGTPCFLNNIKFINENSISIFIDVPLDILAERLTQNDIKRPLFKDISSQLLPACLADLLKTRLLNYLEATHTINGSKNIDAIVEELVLIA